MPDMNISREHKICALCRYWNGVIGSQTIKVLPGGQLFRIDNQERHDCFKPGIGLSRNAIQVCQFFKPRYED